MSRYFRLWLRERIIGLVGVQQCAIGPASGLLGRSYPPDLRVALWTGNVIHIYILHEPLKTRSIKSILQHDTGQSIGSMFIAAPNLLPQRDELFSPPEWLMALHSLNNERIYTFPAADHDIALLQVHFERVDAIETYEGIYGPPVVFEKLHFGRVSIKPRYIKGFWTIAHLGKEAFWQGEKRTRYTVPPRQTYTPSNNHQQGSRTGTRQSAQAAHPKTPLDLSYEQLGVGPDASHEEVKLAFRQRVFSVHPDVSALPKSIAEEKFRVLTEAYETIKIHRGWS